MMVKRKGVESAYFEGGEKMLVKLGILYSFVYLFEGNLLVERFTRTSQHVVFQKAR
jgi:hypothetical protein